MNKKKEQFEEIWEQIEKGKITEEINLSKSNRLLRFILSLAFTLTVFVISVGILFYFNGQKNLPETYFSKSIQKDITSVIQNGADINTVKHLYNSKEIKQKLITDLFFKKEGDFYPESTTLFEILNDIKVQYYLAEKTNETYLNSLDKIIEIHNQVNPFDKLESNQKFIFENMRTKLDSNYVFIQDDLNRVADELNNKNLLVNQYLEKSNLSYWISILALALTIILSTIQIYQNRNSKKINEFIINLFKTETSSKEDGKE